MSLRFRLTALYAGLFLITSAALLVTVNVLLRAVLEKRVDMLMRGPLPLPGPPVRAVEAEIERAIGALPDLVLAYQWDFTLLVMVVLTAVALGSGWWMAGRVLRPIHHITATARRLSLSNLHERIALRGPHDELRELADTFDAMLERLERSVDTQSRFAANASHELRTPLAIQRAAIEIGLADPGPEELARIRHELLETTKRSERLIDGLLLLAQSDRGLVDLEAVALDDVVRQVAGESAAHDLDVRLDLEPCTVTGDPILLTRLVANLLDNATRHNRPGGSVTVSLYGDRRLLVSNTGPVVPGGRVGELFEPFRRLHSRTRSLGGAGLGLSIVASIAAAHDAEVRAEANAGGGLTLEVRFR
ncbi:sensor histidine kinase [Nonomuraea soli]|uniref:histidine kinase n=1 Tax=Nonomuraea soli TaxID=1032476 RepID=A0A7W0CHX2_9ACTN|nr:ATP-binding protein [Nonomuraea soli]MBA2891493.1 signal transduction histidine kinase [Nonomuraea soli]